MYWVAVPVDESVFNDEKLPTVKYPDHLFLEFAIAGTDGLPRFELK